MAISDANRSQLEKRLAKASHSAIRAIMPRLTKYWQTNSWLSHRNPYRKNAVSKIKGNSKLNHTQLSEYIAASAIVHCFDGWSYLGRALESEMAGDPDAARHLGYYAELRAAMSILASEGIGVFQRRHVVVERAKRCLRLEKKFGPTHEFVWNVLEIWAKSEAGKKAVLQSIKPGGLSLSEWLDQFGAGSQFVATEWLHQWGLDLSRLADDREARNVASYRPTAFTTPGSRAIDDTMKGILEFWRMCDPGADGGFPVLDRHLLRRSLKLLTQQLPSSQAKTLYSHRLGTMLNGITPSDLSSNEWSNFLSYKNLKDTPGIISDASGRVGSYHLNHSKQVLARATLLLRIATGCSADLVKEVGSTVKTDLEFWWLSLFVRRRLWPETAPPPSSSIDLWQDVEDESDSITQWLKKKGADACRHSLWTECASAASTLATTERAFLWGVGL